MAIRNTQTALEILARSDNPPVFNTQTALEILARSDNPPVFNTQTVIEILEVTNHLKMGQQFVDVLSRNNSVNSLILGQQFVDVLSRDNPQNSLVLGQQFITVISKNNPPVGDKQDDFTGNNGDPPNNSKWTRTQDNGTAEIQNNKLKLTQNVAGNTKIESKFSYDADFDITANVQIITLPNVTQEVGVDLWVASNGDGGLDRAMVRAGQKTNTKKVMADAWVNDVDQLVVEDNRVYDYLGLRLKRVNGDLFIYVQDGADWKLLKQVNNWSNKNVQAKIAIYNQVSSNMDVDVDDYDSDETPTIGGPIITLIM